MELDRLKSHLSGLSHDQLLDMLVKLDRTHQGHSLFRGVAHDLSNASQALSMGAPAVQAGEIEPEKWLAMTGWVDEKMNRAAAVARDFGTLGADEERPVLVQEILNTANDWQQLQRAQPVGQISCKAPLDLPPVRASDRLLRQILLALIANAKEAAVENQEAKISLDAMPDSDGVTIVVDDHGTGIAPSIKEEVFDAFFTTKDPELHVGLGLTVAVQSAQSWGGKVDLRDIQPSGTRVELFLPYWTRIRSEA
jgi:C4-dicarboxylate-specific signal transduction histidine kinase